MQPHHDTTHAGVNHSGRFSHPPMLKGPIVGGSGIIVSPVTYIFEEEPPRYKAMLAALR